MFQWKVKILIVSFGFFLLASGSAICAEDKEQNDQAAEVQKVLNDADANTAQNISPVAKASSAPPLKANFKKSNQNVDQVQNQLKDVIKTNQGIQEDYMKRMEKIQAISMQAKIHQKILENIKNQSPSRPTTVQQAVQQEKIRLIADQARKNHELLKTLRSTQQKTS